MGEVFRRGSDAEEEQVKEWAFAYLVHWITTYVHQQQKEQNHRQSIRIRRIRISDSVCFDLHYSLSAVQCRVLLFMKYCC